MDDSRPLAGVATFESKEQFVGEVLKPFGARFSESRPFRPVAVWGVYADGDTVIVLWDGEGTRACRHLADSQAWLELLHDAADSG